MANETNGGSAGGAGGLSGLSGVSIRRPVFTTMMMVALVVLGLFSFRRLAIDLYPDVDIPVVSVQTIYSGASSETVEREVTRRLEEAFNPVAGVDRITSISLEGVSQMDAEEIRKALREEVQMECADELRALRREVLDRSEKDLQNEAKKSCFINLDAR